MQALMVSGARFSARVESRTERVIKIDRRARQPNGKTVATVVVRLESDLKGTERGEDAKSWVRVKSRLGPLAMYLQEY